MLFPPDGGEFNSVQGVQGCGPLLDTAYRVLVRQLGPGHALLKDLLNTLHLCQLGHSIHRCLPILGNGKV